MAKKDHVDVHGKQLNSDTLLPGILHRDILFDGLTMYAW